MTCVDLRNPLTPWENEIWTPAPLFQGETVFCLASGPSLTQATVDKIRGRKVIAINCSARLVLAAGISDAVLFFTDSGWYEPRRDLVRDWPGPIISLSRLAKRELDDPTYGRALPRVLRVKTVGDPGWPPRLPGVPKRLGFPPPGSAEIHAGRSSGHTAVSLAVGCAAARVALVGYDMRVIDGREHFHSEYSGPRDLGLYDEWPKLFAGWNEAARNSGTEIVNCTPGSAITEFPCMDLDEVLATC